MVKVLVACEYSGRVRDAFSRNGHDAVSVDLLPSETEGQHIQGDVLDVIKSQKWDLMVAFPPCTHLAVSGARHFIGKRADGRQQEALDFVRALLDAPIEKIAIENPVSVISSYIRRPDQIIQPYHFGHTVQKTTCLWLKNLPPLKYTKVVEPEMVTMQNGERMSKFHYDTFRLPHSIRGHVRSETFEGIAVAMAEQWGVEKNAYQMTLPIAKHTERGE